MASASRPKPKPGTSVPPLSPRAGKTRNADETRRRLLQAAARVFDREGYFATDTNRIAKRAGYAPASFYKHFRDKREIFLAAYDEWVADEWQALGSLGVRPQPSAVVAAVLAHHKKWAGFRASVVALSAIDPAVREARTRRRKRQVGRLHEQLSVGRKPPSVAQLVALLLTFERLCDAVAWQEAQALGLSERAVRATLAAQLAIVLE